MYYSSMIIEMHRDIERRHDDIDMSVLLCVQFHRINKKILS